MDKSVHLPGLNGLRAIAALSVMWGHIFQKDFGEWGITGYNLPLVADGVTLFFVISGFLITYLLLIEQDMSHTVNIPKFYIRRILRIWPIYYLYLIIATLVTATWNDSQIWYYCFFTANIPFMLAVGIWPIMHYWSIGVEEQFYLFWPCLLKLSRGKTRRLLIMAIIVCVVWLSCKWGFYIIYGKTIAYRFFAVTRFDCMMIGAIGAILYYTKNKPFCNITKNRILGLICFPLLLFSQMWANHIPAPVRPQVLAILSLICITNQLNHPIINLENKVCDFIGKISYGIYVIHPILIFILSSLYRNTSFQLPIVISNILVYCSTTAITIFFAWFSYRFYESHFLRLKNKYTIVPSLNSMKK